MNSPWDDELKLAEHEKFFIDFKSKGYKVFWTDSLTFNKLNNTNKEYRLYRERLGDYIKILKEKLGTKGWVIYPK